MYVYQVVVVVGNYQCSCVVMSVIMGSYEAIMCDSG